MRGLEDTTVEQWDKVMAINLRSTFLTMQYCSEVMKKQGYGSIVNTSSIAGITGRKYRTRLWSFQSWNYRSYKVCCKETWSV